MDSKNIHMFTFILMVIGALNWGLVGLFGFNFVTMILSGYPMLEKLVYIVVGLSAAYELAIHKGYCKYCGKK